MVLWDKYVFGASPRLVNYGKWVLKPYLFKLVVFPSFKETKLYFVRRQMEIGVGRKTTSSRKNSFNLMIDFTIAGTLIKSVLFHTGDFFETKLNEL